MKKVLLTVLTVVGMSAGVNAQSCCTPEKENCKPKVCCPTDIECCENQNSIADSKRAEKGKKKAAKSNKSTRDMKAAKIEVANVQPKKKRDEN